MDQNGKPARVRPARAGFPRIVGVPASDIGATETTVSISGTVFLDYSADGIQQAGEPGFLGRRVFIDLNHNGVFDTNEPVAFTNASGDYVLDGGAGRDLHRPRRWAVRQRRLRRSGPAKNVVATGDVTGVDFGAVIFHPAVPIFPIVDAYVPHPNANADAAFVKGLYHEVLNRDGEAAGINGWLLALSTGATRFQVVQGFVNSLEHRERQVDEFYRTFLNRSGQ